MLDADAGNLIHPEQLGRLDAAVTGDDLVVPVDQDRVVEPELTDRGRDLMHLLAECTRALFGYCRNAPMARASTWSVRSREEAWGGVISALLLSWTCEQDDPTAVI